MLVFGLLYLFGNFFSLYGDIVEGFVDLKEIGDYMGFVRYVRGGFVEFYNKVS